MGLADKVRTLFSSQERSSLQNFLLRNEEAFLSTANAENVRVIEGQIEKDFEYYTGKYKASVQDMTASQERLVRSATDMLRFYTPALFGSAGLDGMVDGNLPATLPAVGALAAVQGMIVLNKYMRYRGDVKIACGCKQELLTYIVNHPELREDSKASLVAQVEEAEKSYTGRAGGTEIYHQLQKYDSIIKAHEATMCYHQSKVNMIGGRTMQNQETGVRNASDLRDHKKDYSTRLKALDDRVTDLEGEKS